MYKYQILPRPYVGSYEGEKGNMFLKGKWIVGLAKSFELFLMVSISDLITVSIFINRESICFLQKKISQKNAELGIHILRH